MACLEFDHKLRRAVQTYLEILKIEPISINDKLNLYKFTQAFTSEARPSSSTFINFGRGLQAMYLLV
jgi:hypothetical protein